MPLEGRKPKSGDLIEIDRGFYKHWGVYVGDDSVVHLTDVTGMSGLGSSNGQAVVKKQHIKRVVGNCNYWVNNKHDKTLHVYPVSRIIARANKRVGEKRTYQVFADNCEHFANEMRYNTARSDQADRAVGAGIGTLIAIGLGTLALFIGHR
ncbi:ribosome biogenesis protein BRX1-like protein [Platysternon megacephalum]|uniref:Ribosome biogenesis protein BRX1-like protein n=1 Tax=Platysternon megacephalum TaxID=55544 RepID=A0A4D9F2N2_9SAUR|nr:ribosome biogenesis protein BRX1-like protein [Platysternon megacephalum]